MSLTASASTASPRNSSRSLSVRVGLCRSLSQDLWVSADSHSRRSLKVYPIRPSRTPYPDGSAALIAFTLPPDAAAARERDRAGDGDAERSR